MHEPLRAIRYLAVAGARNCSEKQQIITKSLKLECVTMNYLEIPRKMYEFL